jgi:hypothetical protein
MAFHGDQEAELHAAGEHPAPDHAAIWLELIQAIGAG